MVYGYIRVSTEKQTVENQKIAIEEYCKFNNLQNIQWYAETKSGTIDFNKRFLGELISKLQNGDVLIVTEISRLGRSIKMIFDIIDRLMNIGVTVIAIKNNFTLLKDDITAKVLLFAFGLSAEIERNLISERTKLGLERARQAGKYIGGKKGVPRKLKLQGHKKEIKNMLKEGKSKLAIARFYHISPATLYSYMKRINIKY